MRSERDWLRFVLGLLTCWLMIDGERVAAETPRLAATVQDFEVAQCRAFADRKEVSIASPESLHAPLKSGTATGARRWTTGPVAGEVRHFRVVLKQPVLVGTVCSDAEVALLRDEAALPGDVFDEQQWQRIEGGFVRALPRQAPVRAVRLTLRVHNHSWDAVRRESFYPGLWLLSGRFYDPAAFGRSGWASVTRTNEKTKKPEGFWQSLSYWPATRDVAGVLVCSEESMSAPQVAVLDAQQLVHPQIAPPTDWKDVASQRRGAVLAFETPVKTHALRLVTPAPAKTNGRIEELQPVVPLVELAADEAAPNMKSFSFVPPAPVALKYEMPLDGFAAIRIENEAGQHVRRLLAEVERSRGAVLEAWDLRDDEGRAVPPGNYRFVGLARPPLKLTHEISVYNAGSPPWMAPVPGGGWWMADHSPPVAACAIGEHMLFSASGAEFGVPLIATDLDGMKQWHDLHQGAERLVSNGRSAFIVNSGEVFRITTDGDATFSKQLIHKFEYSDTVPGHGSGYIVADRSGAAAFGRLLAVSYSGASAPWVRSGLKASDIELTRCLPRPLPKKVHETDYDPTERFLSAFQIVPSSLVSKFGPAPDKGPLARTLILALKKEVPLGSLVLPAGTVQAYALRPGQPVPPEFIPPETPDQVGAVAKTTAPKVDLLGDSKSDDLLDDLKPRFDPKIWMPLKRASTDRDDIAIAEQPTSTRLIVFSGSELGALDFSLFLERRFRNATPEAKPLVLEGKPTKSGGWQFLRDKERPLSYGDPAVAGFVWSQPKSLRGFFLSKPTEWSATAVDVWVGPAETPIDAAALRDNSHWQQVHLHQQTKNHIKLNWHTNRVIVGDFGETLATRAVRIRVVEPPSGAGAQQKAFVAGGFEGFIALEPFANDPEREINLAQRVTLLDLPEDDAPQRVVPLAPVLRGEGLGVRGNSSGGSSGSADAEDRPSPPTPLPGVPGRGEKDAKAPSVATNTVATNTTDGAKLAAKPDAKATVRKHLPVPHPSALAFDKSGALFVACDDGVCRLDIESADSSKPAPRKVIVPRAEFGKARALAFDQEGLLYLLDGGRQQVRVFDPRDGKLVRTFGRPGGDVGPYDPQELSVPSAMAFDRNDKLWIVETHFQPKRITRWSKTGTLEKELYGPTHYGGGGMLDPGDRTVINHLGMKFRIDYATRSWKLEARLARYGNWHFLTDRVTYVRGQRYLIGDRTVVTSFGDDGPLSVICSERNGVAVPLVATGLIGDWPEFVKNPLVQQLAAGVNPAQTAFVWSDSNDDAQVQANEVLVLRDRVVRRAPYIGDDLSLNFTESRVGFRLRAVTSDSVVPRYDLSKLEEIPELTGEVMVTNNGETFVMQHKLLDDSGRRVWLYPDRYAGVQASYQTPWGFTGRPAGTVVGSLGPLGHFEIAGERLFCVNGNNGDYYAFTHDGLLAAAIVGGPRGYGKRYFTMPDYEPGKTDLTDLRKTVEDFKGHITRAEDGRVYAIAGKNHVTLMRVDGLENMQRFNGTVSVTRVDLERTNSWLAAKTRIERFLDPDGAKRYRVTQMAKPPVIDGETLTDWPDRDPVTVHTSRNPMGKVVQLMQAKLAFDAEHLYVAGYAMDDSPLANNFTDPAVLFQHGDAFDLQLGLNSQAPAERNEAAAGDVRLLFTQQGEKPTVMLFRYVDGPGSPPKGNGAPRTFTSPVSEQHVAEIRSLTEARAAFSRTKDGWTFEAAIPWRSLGRTAPTKSTILRGDFGVLESDPNGRATIARHYWANKRQVTISDQPSESRVLPGLWGEFELVPSDLVDSLLDGAIK